MTFMLMTCVSRGSGSQELRGTSSGSVWLLGETLSVDVEFGNPVPAPATVLLIAFFLPVLFAVGAFASPADGLADGRHGGYGEEGSETENALSEHQPSDADAFLRTPRSAKLLDPRIDPIVQQPFG